MTSLSQQLQRLALPQNDPSLLARHEVASLLFDCKEAARIDRDTIFAIGCTGLEELIGIDPSFQKFESALFSQLAKSLERSVQTKAVNKQLDDNISLFLIHLSPYFMLKPAQKCLEWLIHRFHIHLYNQDSLIGCVLPYHETKIFVRVIQLLKISSPTHKWNWLEPVKMSGVHLAKGTLVTHCYKDLGFMDFICSLVTKSVKVFSDCPGSSAQLRVLLTFYASTIVSALVSANDISDTLVAKLFPYIQKGLKSSLPDYRAATYMIICQVSVKVTMADTFVHSLASQMCKTLTKIPSLIKDGLGCLIVLLQRQKVEGLGKKLFAHLCNVPDLVSLLHEISVAYDISPLLHYMLPHLVVTIIHHVMEEEEETEELDSHIYARLLEDILKDISLENNLDHLLASTLLEEYISCSSQKETDSKAISLLNEQLLPLIRLLESKYPKTLDLVLEDHLKDVTDPQKQEVFHQFISLSTSGGKFQFLADSDTCLMLSLNHPLAPVRLLAVNHLKNIMETSKESIDDSFIKDAIIMRLGDDNLDVVLSAVNAFEVFKKEFSPEETVSSLLSLFQRAGLSQDGAWYKILELATDILIKEEILSGNDQLLNQVVIHLLPFMVVTNDNSKSQEMKMATYLSESGICSLHPILKGWKEALEEVIKTTKPAELIGVANQKMVQLLADNINSGNPSSVVEDLIAFGEKESYTLKQKVTSQVIISVLVSCCSSLKETHLTFALRVFNLLERKIRETEIITSLEISFEYHSEQPDKGIPVEIWIQYVEKLNRGQMIAVEDAVMFAFSLKSFIQVLKPPKSFLKDDKWWNPEHMKEDSRDYLRLLIQIFEVIIAGADAHHFRDLMRIFLKVHLEDVFELFKFFSLLWTYNNSLSNPLNYPVKIILQTQALYMGHAMLSHQAIQKKKYLASTSSPVVTCLLINLGSPVREVRRAAIRCLQAFCEVESPFHPIIQHLVIKEEEIISDATYVAQDLNTLFKDLQTGKKPKSNQKLTEALKHLLYCVHSCPSYIAKGLMKILQEVNSEMVLSQLLPTIDQLLEKILKEPPTILKDEAIILYLALGKYNEHSASLLHKDPQSLEVFIKAMHTTKEVIKGMPTFQILALGKITKPFFAAISDEKVQQKLLGMLFDLLLNCKNILCAQNISSVFKTISVDAEQIRLELEPPEKAKSLGTVQQTRRQKMQQKKLQDTEPVQDVGNTYWQRVTLILELLQHKKKLKSPQLLVPCLFNLLSRCLETLPPEQGNLEYTKQLILSCLLNICQKLSPDGSKIPKGILDEEKFNVELLVQCVRVSEMPQTHHHAFLLLGAVAGIFPDKVLHNIMPIFTFMGANVMRLDDTYSFQVIKKTVKMVIPALIQADSGDSADLTRNIEEVGVKIINVFVDALPHVPEHRRLPILVELVDTLGAEKFLWILLLLLFEQYVTKTVLAAAHGEKDAILETDTEFWISVSCEFTVQQQLQSLMDILKYLTELPEKKETEEPPKTVSHKTKTQEQMVQIFNVDTHTSKQLRHFTFLSVSFMSQLLASHNFIKKVMEGGGAIALQGLEQRLLESVLGYINSVAQSVKENADKLTAKFWRALLSKAYDMLDKVNSLLPTETFIPVIRGLLTNQLPSVRRKAMDLLNNKLHQYAKWKKGQVTLFLKLVPDLLAIAQHKIKEKEEEQAINRQTALYSLKLLCKNFGTGNSEAFIPVLNAAINLINPEIKDEKNVLGSALLCIAEVTYVLGARAIPHLPRLMPALLTTLENTNELVASEVYLLSALAALQKVVETLPHFLSPYLHGILMQAIRWESIAREMGPTSQAVLQVTSLKAKLATTLSPRVLLSALNTVYKQIGKNWKIRIGPFMSILQEHIAVMEKEDLNSHQSQLTAFFLEALNFRAQHSEDNLEEVGQTESCIIHCVVSMVMKLSEVTFRPLFFKLFDWARTEDAPKDRLLTFCNLADCIAEKLKGLFTLFAGHLVKPFADTLNQINISKTDEAFFDSENEPEKSCLLLQFILDCLHKIFLFDTQHFVSKERAEALMMPLVDQLENMLGGEETFQERVTKHLIPCIAQFSVAMADDSLWKPLNYQILLKMRHTSPKVRFAALITVLELAEKLRENYIVLLPESIPFLAELMEDECEEVENQCQKTIQQLEVILGEPLQSYF